MKNKERKFVIKTEEVEIDVDGVVYVEKTTYREYDDESREVACVARFPKYTEEAETPVSQLDRIEANTAALLENTSALDVLLGV